MQQVVRSVNILIGLDKRSVLVASCFIIPALNLSALRQQHLMLMDSGSHEMITEEGKEDRLFHLHNDQDSAANTQTSIGDSDGWVLESTRSFFSLFFFAIFAGMSEKAGLSWDC